MALPDMPSNTISRERLRIGGGYGAAASGTSPAGGLDVDNAGNVATDGGVTIDGAFECKDSLAAPGIHNNGGTGADGVVASGTYTPTATAVTNCASVTPSTIHWLRVGKVVTVSGHVAATPTTAGTVCYFRMSLPAPTNISSNAQLGGAGSSAGGDILLGIRNDSTNDEAQFGFTPSVVGGHNFWFSYSYRIA